MSKRYLVLIFIAFSFLAIPIAISGGLKDFETSGSSGSSSSSGGCAPYDHHYYDPYYYNTCYSCRTAPTTPSTGEPKPGTLEKIEASYKFGTTPPAPKTENEAPGTVTEEGPPLLCKGESLVSPTMACLKSIKSTDYPGIPTIKFYGGYQKLLGQDIQGYNLNLQAGHGMWAFEADFVHYFETNPPDRLKIITPRLLFRFPSRYFEIDGGIGATVMRGSMTNTGLNIGGAVDIFPIKNLIIESKLYVSSFSGKKYMVDWDNALIFKYKMLGVRGGYRMMATNGNQTLHGPQVGLFVQW